MKKYRINWSVVTRNVAIVLFIVICHSEHSQIKAQEIELAREQQTPKIDVVFAKHDANSVIKHEPITLLAQEEKCVKTQSRTSNNREYLGKFKITHYCACKKCCGPNAQGITASGKRVEEGKTIAVDRSVIKLGSQVYIDGYGTYEAQDTGSAIKGNKIDVYVADHQRALQLGVVYKDVYLMNEV